MIVASGATACTPLLKASVAGAISIDLLIYLPAAATKPVPMFFSINFGAVQNAVDDPGIKSEKTWDPKTNTRVTPPAARGFGHIDAEDLLNAGFGVATF